MKDPTVGNPVYLPARQQAEACQSGEGLAGILSVSVDGVDRAGLLGKKMVLHKVCRLAAEVSLTEKEKNGG
jgi:hypothetical protein